MDGFYALYKRSRNTAWQALIDFHVSSLPVKVSSICKDMQIQLSTYEQAMCFLSRYGLLAYSRKQSGMAVFYGGKWYIFYDSSTVKNGRARFTVAHELGHILLGHGTFSNGSSVLFRDRNNSGDLSPLSRSPEERAADMFAARLLAPACILHAIKAYDPESIMNLCGISRQAATYRADRLAILRQRNHWFDDPLERQVYEQFLPFVQAFGKLT